MPGLRRTGKAYHSGVPILIKMTIKLAVFDMDGVLTLEKSSWGFVNRYLGIDSTRNLENLMKGKIEYEDLFTEEVRNWLNINRKFSGAELIKILSGIRLSQNLVASINEINRTGIRCAIISGGLYPLASRIGEMSGIHIIRANDIVLDSDGLLTPEGRIMVDPRKKDLVLREIQKSLGINENETVSVGDSPEDEKMFIHSGKSIFISHSGDNKLPRSSLVLGPGNMEPIKSAIINWNRDSI